MSDPELVVLVHIEEAHGLCIRKEKVFINASLGGLTLQTEAVVPEQNTIFDFNIIWETDKKAIKHMKTANLPIKLECFSTNGTVRHPIGFVIIPIRGVPILQGDRIKKAVPIWHKLIGVSSEWKALKPEISIYCTITNPENVDHLDLQRDLKSYKFLSTSKMLSSQNGLFVELNEVGQYIQLGNGPDDITKYAVHINFSAIHGFKRNNLSADDDSFHIQYVLFGNTSEDRVLIPTAEDALSVQEKITINFRASLQSIKNYFKNVFHIPVDLFYNNEIVGFAKFSLDLPTLTDSRHPQGLVHQESGSCPFTKPSEETTLRYEFYINRLSPFIEIVAETTHELTITPLAAIRHSIDKEFEAITISDDDQSSPSIEDPLLTNDFYTECQTPVTPLYEDQPEAEDHDTINDLIILSASKYSNIPTPKFLQKTFSYKIVLDTIEFNRKIVQGIWQLSLAHNMAHTPVTISNISVQDESSRKLRNLELVLYFSANPSEVRQIIASEACVMNIKGPNRFLATAKLNNGTLLDQNDQMGIILMENESAEKVAIVHAYAVLEDLGTNLNVMPHHVKPVVPIAAQKEPHLDEELAYKMVEELEAWKIRQQETYLIELKQRETTHLAQLSDEWTKRRSELESELLHKVEQCRVLTHALEEANQTLKNKHEEDAIANRNLHESSVERERSLRLQVLRLQEEIRSTKVDSEHAVKVANLKYDDACHKFDSLEKVHGHCRLFIADLEKELSALRLRSDENDMLRELIEDMKIKFGREQSSKMFFKQKWTSTKQELELLRLKRFTTDEEEIENSLTEAILSEKVHLVNEKQELQSIQEALEHA